MSNRNYPRQKVIGVSIHPLNRKMEFQGYKSIKTEVSPTLTAHDGRGGEPCVWIIEYDD